MDEVEDYLAKLRQKLLPDEVASQLAQDAMVHGVAMADVTADGVKRIEPEDAFARKPDATR